MTRPDARRDDPAGGRGRRAARWMLGMAHRGRLNVLAHILGQRVRARSSREFEGASRAATPSPTIPQGGTGDVKYHLRRRRRTCQIGDGELDHRAAGVRTPSHLEFVDPGRRGRRRAPRRPSRQRPARAPRHQRGDPDHPARRRRASRARASSPRRSTCRRCDGYTRRRHAAHHRRTTRSASRPTRTTSRSTPTRRDLAKGFDVPIIHVNADDVGGVHLRRAAGVRVPRSEFGHDLLIDLVGYRRFGHNETRRAGVHPARACTRRSSRPPDGARACSPRELVARGRRRRADEALEMMAGRSGAELARARTAAQGRDVR